MREIKFRAWDKDKSEMIEWEALRMTYASFLNTPNDWLYDCMQYTGLNDKNGKEIYEGDLYQIEGLGLIEVKWLDGDDGYYCWNIGRNDGEVIGNIYENPELLERKA